MLKNDIKVISARTKFEKLYPNNKQMWKIHAFLETGADMQDHEAITNLIVVGDSVFEIEAGQILGAQFKKAFIKTIKFCKSPNITQLLKQIRMFVTKFENIHSEARNL